MFDEKKVYEVTGLSIEGNQVQNDDGKVFYVGISNRHCESWLSGYVKGSLDGIREAMEKFGVDQIAS